jgi:hypothetical protein
VGVDGTGVGIRYPHLRVQPRIRALKLDVELLRNDAISVCIEILARFPLAVRSYMLFSSRSGSLVNYSSLLGALGVGYGRCRAALPYIHAHFLVYCTEIVTLKTKSQARTYPEKCDTKRNSVAYRQFFHQSILCNYFDHRVTRNPSCQVLYVYMPNPNLDARPCRRK